MKDAQSNGLPPNAEPSDGVLLRRYQNRDLDAATQLYVRYAHRLRKLAQAQCSSSLARKVEPDDIVQSVFGSFFRRAAQGQYNVPDGNELWNLLLVIALNKIRAKGAYYGAAKRDARRTTDLASLERIFEPTKRGNDDIAYTFLKMVITEAMKSCTAQQKQIISLRIDGWEVAEIADQTGASVRSVERCLQQFREVLGEVLNHASE
jgi:RNA polymerase sigma-70 factor, ECF subfamily